MATPCSNNPDEVIEKVVATKADADKFDMFVNGGAAETVQLGQGAATPVIRNVVRQMLSAAASLPNSDVSGKTATADSGSSSRTLASRFADIINVRDFGAVGDGVTDDSASFQAASAFAAARGSKVFVPAGSYKVAITPSAENFYSDGHVEIVGGASLLIEGATEDAPVPSYFETEIQTSINAIKLKRQAIGGKGVEFFFITDTHWENNAKHSPQIIKRMARELDCYDVVFGGDVVTDYHATKEAAIEETTSFFSSFDDGLRLMSTFGNHDANNNNQPDSSKILDWGEVYAITKTREERRGGWGLASQGDTYCSWMDNDSQKTRLIHVRHTGPGAFYGTTVDRAKAACRSLPSGWHVIFFCHAALQPWNDAVAATDIAALGELVDNAIATGVDPIAFIVGHTHQDRNFTVTTPNGNSLLIVTTTCDAYGVQIQGESSPAMTLGTYTEQAFDFVQVDTTNNKIYFTRVGAGSDREFTYPNSGASTNQFAEWASDKNLEIEKYYPAITLKNTSKEKGVESSGTAYSAIYCTDNVNEDSTHRLSAISLSVGPTNDTRLTFNVYTPEQDSTDVATSLVLVANSSTRDGENYINCAANVIPNTSGSKTLGASGINWKELYLASQSSINYSDERLKEISGAVQEPIFRAWGNVRAVVYKFKDAVAEKRENARNHIGYVAQAVRDAFSAEGLDAGDFGLFCYDSWNKSDAVFDEHGNELEPAREAGDVYSLRYGECLVLECAYQRWLGEKRDARIAALEARLGAMEK